MAQLILDTGALIALERGDRQLAARLARAGQRLTPALTSSACVAEAWRDPRRQARLVTALRSIRELPLDARAARSAGELMGAAGTNQIADAAIANLVSPGDAVLTSDRSDLAELLRARGVSAVFESA